MEQKRAPFMKKTDDVREPTKFEQNEHTPEKQLGVLIQYSSVHCRVNFLCRLLAMDSRNATSPVTRVTITECPDCGANGECQPGAARPVEGNNYYRNASCLCNMGYQGMLLVKQQECKCEEEYDSICKV